MNVISHDKKLLSIDKPQGEFRYRAYIVTVNPSDLKYLPKMCSKYILF